MNDVLKRPLATSAVVLMLAFGAMPAHAEMAEPNGYAANAVKAETRATAPGAAAKAADPEGASDADTVHRSDGADVASTAGDAETDKSFARSKTLTKSIQTPHMAMSITRSKSMAKSADGDTAKAHAMAKAKALDTPGPTRTDTTTKATVKVDGDTEADAAATADARVDDSGMRVETFGETSVAVE